MKEKSVHIRETLLNRIKVMAAQKGIPLKQYVNDLLQQAIQSATAKILIVEDDEDQVFLIEESLSAHTIKSIYTPKMALELMNRYNPGVIILDNHFPTGEKGVDILPKIHNEERLIILISGQPIREDLSSYRNLVILNKPFNCNDLIPLIDDFLKNKD